MKDLGAEQSAKHREIGPGRPGDEHHQGQKQADEPKQDSDQPSQRRLNDNIAVAETGRILPWCVPITNRVFYPGW
jgi:hypothetical protein